MDGSESRIRHVVGAMTGTSIDGIDVALVEIRGSGLSLQAHLIRARSASLGQLANDLRACCGRRDMNAREFASIALRLGVLHADVMQDLCRDMKPDLICLHGQTVFHEPPISWQLINPQPVASRLGCPVVFDLRQADLTAGGQGAPITPLADWVLFRDAARSRAIVNLGGFCNMTLLPRNSQAEHAAVTIDQIRAFDVCACNHLLDGAARRLIGQPMDDAGTVASRGRSNPVLQRELSEMLSAQRQSGRSLGTDDECSSWLDKMATQCRAEDGLATVTHALALFIATTINDAGVDEVVCAGGGCHHATFMQLLKSHAHTDLHRSDDLGIPVEMREAMCMAVLGALCADGIGITLPRVTGCDTPAPVAGVWCLPQGRKH